jgi:hypothetical protein
MGLLCAVILQGLFDLDPMVALNYEHLLAELLLRSPC